jgi:hypothetical protein
MVNLLILIGPTAMLAVLLAVPIVYLAFRPSLDSGKRVSFFGYLSGAFGAGVAGYFIGAALGIGAACYPEDAGNLCGLAGVFGAGPLLSASAIGVYCFRWAKSVRRTAAG